MKNASIKITNAGKEKYQNISFTLPKEKIMIETIIVLVGILKTGFAAK
jgi:hypothetical protein